MPSARPLGGAPDDTIDTLIPRRTTPAQTEPMPAVWTNIPRTEQKLRADQKAIVSFCLLRKPFGCWPNPAAASPTFRPSRSRPPVTLSEAKGLTSHCTPSQLELRRYPTNTTRRLAHSAPTASAPPPPSRFPLPPSLPSPLTPSALPSECH